MALPKEQEQNFLYSIAKAIYHIIRIVGLFTLGLLQLTDKSTMFSKLTESWNKTYPRLIWLVLLLLKVTNQLWLMQLRIRLVPALLQWWRASPSTKKPMMNHWTMMAVTTYLFVHVKRMGQLMTTTVMLFYSLCWLHWCWWWTWCYFHNLNLDSVETVVHQAPSWLFPCWISSLSSHPLIFGHSKSNIRYKDKSVVVQVITKLFIQNHAVRCAKTEWKVTLFMYFGSIWWE